MFIASLFIINSKSSNSFSVYLPATMNYSHCCRLFFLLNSTNSFKSFLKQSQLNQARKHQGIKSTWPSAFNNIGLSIPIDHILLSPQIDQFELTVLPTMGSDHLPLFLKRLCLKFMLLHL